MVLHHKHEFLLSRRTPTPVALTFFSKHRGRREQARKGHSGYRNSQEVCTQGIAGRIINKKYLQQRQKSS
jgi:hypothetical protein